MAETIDLSRPKLARTHRMQWEEAQNCYVLLYPEGMVTLNNSAQEILSRCDGDKTVSDIVAELQAAFPGNSLEDDVFEFIRLASQQGWIELDP